MTRVTVFTAGFQYSDSYMSLSSPPSCSKQAFNLVRKPVETFWCQTTQDQPWQKVNNITVRKQP